jgi:hypothetical protein
MTSDWLGGGLIVGLAAVLWLIYLLPTWFRRNEYNATERNVVRLQQTLRILAETSEVPDEVRAEASARSVVEHQRLLKKVTVNSIPPALRAAAKIRKARAVTSGILVLSLIVAVLGAVQTAVNGAWIVLVVGLIAATLCVTRLGRLAKDGRAIKLPVQDSSSSASTSSSLAAAADDLAVDAVEFDGIEVFEGSEEADSAELEDSSWTPVPLPKPLYTERRRLRQLTVGQPVSSSYGSAVSGSVGFAEQTASQAEEALRAAASTAEQALRAGYAAQDARAAAAGSADDELTAAARPARAADSAGTEPAGSAPGIPSRFSTMGIVDDAETGSLDVDLVLARRRAG